MVSARKPDRSPIHRAPAVVGGVSTQNTMVRADDVEEHFQRGKAAGATIVK